MKVFQQIEATATNMKLPFTTGMTLSSDLFYASVLKPSSLEMYSKGNVDVVEMEISTLFVIGYLNKIQTGALCVVDGSPLQWNEGNYDPSGDKMKAGTTNMLKVAIAACVSMTAQQQK
eukprot:GHVS01037275.1.p2 GENE.GHVS01037275.1~~GHVS01037275.1.p2  ORF type:complete len:118 (+),score=30.18 GHVS01037275.1:438-791(+)